MLAGGAPLHAERLAARGGPGVQDPLSYYDVSSYGPRAIDAMVRVVGIEPLVYGTDRPVIEPASLATLGDAANDAITVGQPVAPARPRRRRRMIERPRGRDLSGDELLALVRDARGPPGAVARARRARPRAAHLRADPARRARRRMGDLLVRRAGHRLPRPRPFRRRGRRGAGRAARGAPRARRRNDEPDVRSGRGVRLQRRRHPPRAPCRRRAGDLPARLLAAAVAHGRLRDRPRPASCAATRCPTQRSSSL